jgi:hypothetical protein
MGFCRVFLSDCNESSSTLATQVRLFLGFGESKAGHRPSSQGKFAKIYGKLASSFNSLILGGLCWLFHRPLEVIHGFFDKGKREFGGNCMGLWG